MRWLWLGIIRIGRLFGYYCVSSAMFEIMDCLCPSYLIRNEDGSAF